MICRDELQDVRTVQRTQDCIGSDEIPQQRAHVPAFAGRSPGRRWWAETSTWWTIRTPSWAPRDFSATRANLQTEGGSENSQQTSVSSGKKKMQCIARAFVKD